MKSMTSVSRRRMRCVKALQDRPLQWHMHHMWDPGDLVPVLVLTLDGSGWPAAPQFCLLQMP